MDEEKEDDIIHYVVGDVTHPLNTFDKDAVIVHCVDNSGVWGSGGVFTSLSNRSLHPAQQYITAGKMKDLALGDVHLIPIDDIQSRQQGRDYLALIVAQTRDSQKNLSGIKLAALRHSFRKLSSFAKQNKASVHLPRIGYNTPGFNWYGTERLIRKYFVSKRIPTYVYYFSKRIEKRKHEETTIQVKRMAGSNERPSSAAAAASNTSFILPSFANGLIVYFHDVSEDNKKKMSRYIVAYDGDVAKNLQSDVTHIILDNSSNKESLGAILKKSDVQKSAKIVRLEWIIDSVEKQRLLNVIDYEISIHL